MGEYSQYGRSSREYSGTTSYERQLWVSTHSTASGTTSYERQLWVVLDSLRLTYKEPPPPAHEKQVGRACGFYCAYLLRVLTSTDPRGQVLRSLQKIVRGRYAERHDERDEIGRRALSWRRNPPVGWPAATNRPWLGLGPLSRWVGVDAGRTALHCTAHDRRIVAESRGRCGRVPGQM